MVQGSINQANSDLIWLWKGEQICMEEQEIKSNLAKKEFSSIFHFHFHLFI